jgi:Phosphotransferase enzyme family
MNRSEKSARSLLDVLPPVEAFLNEYPVGTAARPVATHYSAAGKMMLPGFGLLRPKHLLAVVHSLLRGRLHINAFTLNRYCEAILLKNNIRINRPDGRDVSVKIRLPSKSADSLANEIAIRHRLQEEFADLRLTPAILDHDRRNGNWIVEAFVNGSSPRSDDFFTPVEGKLREFYRRTLSFSPLKEEDAAYLQHSRNPIVLELIEQMRAGTAGNIAYALGHGDLVRSNIVREAGGTSYICDWEHARDMPVAFDLAKLYLRYPRYRRPILDLLETLSADSGSMPARFQIGLGIEDFLNYVLIRGKGLNRKQRRRESKGRRLVAELFAEGHRDNSVGQVIEDSTVRVVPPKSLSVQRGRE